MYTTYNVNVLNAQGSQVANPNIFVNGLLNNGNSFSLAPNTSATCQASCNGLSTPEQVVTAPSAGGPSSVPLTMTLPAASTGPVPFVAQTQPATPNLLATLMPAGGVPLPATSGSGGLYEFSTPPGDCTLCLSDPAGIYQPVNQQVTVGPDGGQVPVCLVAGSDAGNKQGLGPVTQPGNNAGLGKVYPEDSVPVPAPMGSEAIYSNAAFQGYYTSAQVHASINGHELDELNTIQWALQTNTIPVYGYSSRDYDALGRGRSLVQGQLVLNYVTENALLTLLRTIPPDPSAKNSNAAPGVSPTDRASAETLASLMQKQQAVAALPAGSTNVSAGANNFTNTLSTGLFTGIGSSGFTQTAPKASQASMQTSLQNRVDEALTQSTPQAVAMAKQMAKQPKQDAYANPVYSTQLFDLRVQIGCGPQPTYRLLEKCKLISNEIICDQSGQPILEAYGFIARRAR